MFVQMVLVKDSARTPACGREEVWTYSSSMARRPAGCRDLQSAHAMAGSEVVSSSCNSASLLSYLKEKSRTSKVFALRHASPSSKWARPSKTLSPLAHLRIREPQTLSPLRQSLFVDQVDDREPSHTPFVGRPNIQVPAIREKEINNTCCSHRPLNFLL